MPAVFAHVLELAIQPAQVLERADKRAEELVYLLFVLDEVGARRDADDGDFEDEAEDLLVDVARAEPCEGDDEGELADLPSKTECRDRASTVKKSRSGLTRLMISIL